MRGPPSGAAEHACASAFHSSITFAHADAYSNSIAYTNTHAKREAQR
jgi:hypothetical protein